MNLKAFLEISTCVHNSRTTRRPRLYDWLLLLLYMQKLCVLRPRKNVVSATSIYTQYWNVYRKYRKKKLCRFLTEWLTWLSDRPSCLPACLPTRLQGYKNSWRGEKSLCSHSSPYIHTYIHLQYYFTVFSLVVVIVVVIVGTYSSCIPR